MSHEATNWAFEQRGLKPATKIVLLGLANRHNPDFGCFPSKKKLAEDCEMSERSVADHLKKLEEDGLIRIESHAGSRSGQFSSNRYILGFEREFYRRQDLPSAKSAVGENTHLPTAKSAVGRRQILPTNPVRDNPVSGNSKSDPVFDAFWSEYPKKAGKAEARKAFAKALGKTTPENLIEKARLYAEWLLSAQPGEFRPQPKNAQGWLNGERWEDELEIPAGENQKTEELHGAFGRIKEVG